MTTPPKLRHPRLVPEEVRRFVIEDGRTELAQRLYAAFEFSDEEWADYNEVEDRWEAWQDRFAAVDLKDMGRRASFLPPDPAQGRAGD